MKRANRRDLKRANRCNGEECKWLEIRNAKGRRSGMRRVGAQKANRQWNALKSATVGGENRCFKTVANGLLSVTVGNDRQRFSLTVRNRL